MEGESTSTTRSAGPSSSGGSGVGTRSARTNNTSGAKRLSGLSCMSAFGPVTFPSPFVSAYTRMALNRNPRRSSWRRVVGECTIITPSKSSALTSSSVSASNSWGLTSKILSR